MVEVKSRIVVANNGFRRVTPTAAGLLLLIFLTACATGQSTFRTQKNHTIPQGASASMDVKFTAKEQQEYQTEIEQMMRRDLPTGLVNAGIFRIVYNISEPADYRINVGVEKVHIVPPGARAMLGALAGKSFVTVQVVVHKNKPSRMITSFQSTGFGASNIVDGYGHGEPVKQAIAEIVKNLQ